MLVSLVVIVVRFLRIFTVATLDDRLRRRFRQAAEPVGWREMTIASWAGMRGVVTLAAALTLPAVFPQRSRLTCIAFVVIIVTLLLQGLTLPMLAKSLDVTAFDDKRDETQQA
jgi:CPA1 family monovalent cation:H+ antiporter